MTDTNHDTITKTIFINAEKSVVWEFLTDKDKLGTWFHRARANLVAGQAYELLKQDENGEQTVLIHGRVLIAEHPNKLSYTFLIGPFQGCETVATWTLETAAQGTRLTLQHTGISTAAGDAALTMLMALDNGWDEHLMAMRVALKAP